MAFFFPYYSRVEHPKYATVFQAICTRTRTDMGGRAITVKGPRNWNTLPTIIQSQPTLKAFKDKLKTYLLNK